MSIVYDRNFAIFNDVLLSCHATQKNVVIPSVTEYGEKISIIGKGAFQNDVNIEKIELSPGIERVNSQAFCNMKKLKEVIFPSTMLSIASDAFFSGTNRYSRIKECSGLERISLYGTTPPTKNLSLPTVSQYIQIKDIVLSRDEYADIVTTQRKGSTSYILSEKCISIPPLDALNRYYEGGNGFIDLDEIPNGVDRIFRLIKNQNKMKPPFYQNAIAIPITNDLSVQVKSEEESLKELINSYNGCHINASSENVNDYKMKIDKPEDVYELCMPVLDSSKTRITDNTVYVTVYLMFGYFFFQSVREVMHMGRRYHIYFRNYINGKKLGGYTRREVVVYCNNELVYNPQEVKEVYAKYKLLSIL